MWLPDVPLSPSEDTAISLVQSFADTLRIHVPDKTFSYCTYAESGIQDSANNSFGLVGEEIAKFFGFEHKLFSLDELSHYKARLIQGPQHGYVRPVHAASHHWTILPNKEYQGTDRAIFLIEAKGRQVEIIVNFRILDLVQDTEEKQQEMPPCEAPEAPSLSVFSLAPAGAPIIETGWLRGSLRSVQLSQLVGLADGLSVTFDNSYGMTFIRGSSSRYSCS